MPNIHDTQNGGYTYKPQVPSLAPEPRRSTNTNTRSTEGTAQALAVGSYQLRRQLSTAHAQNPRHNKTGATYEHKPQVLSLAPEPRRKKNKKNEGKHEQDTVRTCTTGKCKSQNTTTAKLRHGRERFTVATSRPSPSPSPQVKPSLAKKVKLECGTQTHRRRDNHQQRQICGTTRKERNACYVALNPRPHTLDTARFAS